MSSWGCMAGWLAGWLCSCHACNAGCMLGHARTHHCFKHVLHPANQLAPSFEHAHAQVLQRCGMRSVPEVGDVAQYLEQGPGFIFLFHPALGPLWDVIAQKIRGGALGDGSELVLEVAEARLVSGDGGAVAGWRAMRGLAGCGGLGGAVKSVRPLWQWCMSLIAACPGCCCCASSLTQPSALTHPSSRSTSLAG